MYGTDGSDFPPGRQPFLSRHRFRGVVRTPNGSASGLETVVDTDTRGRLGPKGFILGTRETHDQLQELGKYGRMPRSAGLAYTAKGGRSIKAEITFTGSSYLIGPEQPTRVVAEFYCHHITFDSPPLDDSGGVPAVSFLMTGNDAHWMGMEKWDERLRRLATRSEIGTRTLPISMHFEWRELRSLDPVEGETLTVMIPMLVVRPKGKEKRTTDEFLAEAIGRVDDVAALVSFLCGTLLGWYEYHATTAESLRDCHRTVRQPVQRSPYRYDRPVEANDTRRFLSVAVRRARQLRLAGKYPALGMEWTLSARESESSEVAFVSLLFALESLHRAYLRTRKATILPNERFDRLRHDLSTAARRFRPRLSKRQLALVEKKYPEINRPAFWDTLRAMLRNMQVKWDDLYPVPPPAKPLFIDLRNELVHRGQVSNPRQLGLELIRLQAIVERLLLRTLGWGDFKETPRSYDYSLLRTHRGDH